MFRQTYLLNLFPFHTYRILYIFVKVFVVFFTNSRSLRLYVRVWISYMLCRKHTLANKHKQASEHALLVVNTQQCAHATTTMIRTTESALYCVWWCSFGSLFLFDHYFLFFSIRFDFHSVLIVGSHFTHLKCTVATGIHGTWNRFHENGGKKNLSLEFF